MSQRSLEEVFRDADPAQGLTPALLDRVAGRMAAPALPRFQLRRWAVPAAALVGASMAAAAVWRSVTRPAPAVAPAVSRQAPPVVVPPIEEAAPPQAPKPAASHPKRATAVEASPLRPESALLAESRLLGLALHQLRDERDAAAALRTLDTYQHQFPEGALRNEAAIARVDAELAAGQRDAALRVLESLELGAAVPRAAELRLLHAELLSEAGRCGEAIPLFERAQPESGLQERASYGLALCTRKPADFQRYLDAFPAGRFAEQARQALHAP